MAALPVNSPGEQGAMTSAGAVSCALLGPIGPGATALAALDMAQATKVLTTSDATPARMNPTIHFKTSRSASILEKRLS